MICKELYKLYILHYDSFSVLELKQFLEILSTFLKIRKSNRNYIPIYQITTGFRNAYIKNRAEGLACADPVPRNPICVIGN